METVGPAASGMRTRDEVFGDDTVGGPLAGRRFRPAPFVRSFRITTTVPVPGESVQPPLPFARRAASGGRPARVGVTDGRPAAASREVGLADIS